MEGKDRLKILEAHLAALPEDAIDLGKRRKGMLFHICAAFPDESSWGAFNDVERPGIKAVRDLAVEFFSLDPDSALRLIDTIMFSEEAVYETHKEAALVRIFLHTSPEWYKDVVERMAEMAAKDLEHLLIEGDPSSHEPSTGFLKNG